MAQNIIQQKIKVQADACYLALIQNDVFAVDRLAVKISATGNAYISPKFPMSYILPGDMLIILNWCNDHNISAKVVCYLSTPSVKFEGYAL